MVAHEPYLVTADKGALVLWNRKTLEPFSVLQEPHVRRMIVLAESQEVPGESSFAGYSRRDFFPGFIVLALAFVSWCHSASPLPDLLIF